MRKIILSTILFSFIFGFGYSQELRTSYFMQKSMPSSQMNPAVRPYRGYINIPVLGGTSMAFMSNSLTIDKIFYPNPEGDGLVTFLSSSVDGEEFLSKLKDKNHLGIDLSTNIAGFGFYTGKNFWNFGMTLKGTSSTQAPYSLFDFAKNATSDHGSYDLKDIRESASVYLETAVGYNRKINDQLTVGGRLKYITGISHISFDMKEMSIETSPDRWSVTSKGSLDVYMPGAEVTYVDGYIDDVKMNSSGIPSSGSGFGVDLGATYQLLDNLVISGSLIDLGFIKWSSKNAVSGDAETEYVFEGFDIVGDEVTGIDTDDFDKITKFTEVDPRSKRTGLNTTLNIGGEYSIMENKLGFGLLSSTQFREFNTYTELTTSVNYRPLSWFSTSMSYSFIHSQFRTVGLAVNFHPKAINFFLGTDYLMGKVTPQFIPVKQRASNLYFGLSIPIGRASE